MAFQTYNQKASKLLLSELSKIEKYITIHEKHIFIKNSYNLIDKLNNNTKYTSVCTMDFKEMFDNICQKSMLEEILNFYKEYENKVKFKYNFVQFEYLVKQVIQNNYIVFGGEIYKQVTGIPQGLPSSNIASNLLLHTYEKRNWDLHRELLISRYIDDVVILNLPDNYDLNFYPSYLKLIRTNANNSEGNFLDLDIKIINHALSLDIYNKGGTTGFDKIKFQFYCSALHKNIFKNIVLNNIRRINRICSEQKELKIANTCNIAMEYGYPLHMLTKIASVTS